MEKKNSVIRSRETTEWRASASVYYRNRWCLWTSLVLWCILLYLYVRWEVVAVSFLLQLFFLFREIIYGSHFIMYALCRYYYIRCTSIILYAYNNAALYGNILLCVNSKHVNILLCLYCRRQSTNAMVLHCTSKINICHNSIIIVPMWIVTCVCCSAVCFAISF